TDMFLMRLAEVVNAIPFLPLAMILSAIIGSRISETGRISMIMVILGLLNWPSLARLVRGQILAAREQEFVTAAKAMGITEMKIIFKHILPNVITVVLVNLTLSFALSMLYESSLSYLGFGVNEPNATWGNMLYGCNDSTVMSLYWWRWVFPAIALSLCTVSINMAGDGMRDAIDPKSIGR
ncbi:MAG: ABC transporter permease, partial [Spirochaetales bacterium]|nr:ABC transporter permease [Spirochaetales bacterium]